MNANQKDLVVAGSVGLIELPRVVDAYMALHGGSVTADWWPAVHGVSGVGLVLVGAWVAERSVASLVTSRARSGDWTLLRNAVVTFILAALVTMLPPMIGPGFLRGVTDNGPGADPVAVTARALWALAAVVGPLALVVMSPMASRLSGESGIPSQTSQEAQGVAFPTVLDRKAIEAAIDAWDAQKAEPSVVRAMEAPPVRLSNAERQRRFRERKKATAGGES